LGDPVRKTGNIGKPVYSPHHYFMGQRPVSLGFYYFQNLCVMEGKEKIENCMK